MKIFAACIATLLCLLVACSNSKSPPISSPITDKLVHLSGASANDCGILTLGADLNPGWKCAVESDADQRPFWLAVQTRGMDSDVWQAIGRDASGKRYILTYDSNPQGGPTLNPRFTVSTCAGNFEWAPQEPHILGCSGSAP